MTHETQTLLGMVAIAIVTFIVFRNVILWYYKIDEQIKNQEEQWCQSNLVP